MNSDLQLELRAISASQTGCCDVWIAPLISSVGNEGTLINDPLTGKVSGKYGFRPRGSDNLIWKHKWNFFFVYEYIDGKLERCKPEIAAIMNLLCLHAWSPTPGKLSLKLSADDGSWLCIDLANEWDPDVLYIREMMIDNQWHDFQRCQAVSVEVSRNVRSMLGCYSLWCTFRKQLVDMQASSMHNIQDPKGSRRVQIDPL